MDERKRGTGGGEGGRNEPADGGRREEGGEGGRNGGGENGGQGGEIEVEGEWTEGRVTKKRRNILEEWCTRWDGGEEKE